ncbi:winged helix-turn-helix domain-containing protein [Streptomyces qinglanensis]|uniref:winged helix-turn-helix domain-containing protein n=1 Tax=Streptomyces qinglanensis TaxID=943816 RepID=UPI000AE879EE|nr:response regulator transcription factor [Streptomyces qinglanensis]
MMRSGASAVPVPVQPPAPQRAGTRKQARAEGAGCSEGAPPEAGRAPRERRVLREPGIPRQRTAPRTHAPLRDQAPPREPGTPRMLVVGDLALDEENRRARRGGAWIRLTATEFELLRFLMRNPGRVLSKAQILDRVWNYDVSRRVNLVEIYISYVRRKIDTGGEPLIHTRRGAGYVFKPGESVIPVYRSPKTDEGSDTD